MEEQKLKEYLKSIERVSGVLTEKGNVLLAVEFRNQDYPGIEKKEEKSEDIQLVKFLDKTFIVPYASYFDGLKDCFYIDIDNVKEVDQENFRRILTFVKRKTEEAARLNREVEELMDFLLG